MVDFTKGKGELGKGFYTTGYPFGIVEAAKYAWRAEGFYGGVGIVLIFSMKTEEWEMLKTSRIKPNPAAKEAIYGFDCVWAPLGTATQYKWEPGKGALSLAKGFRGFVLIPPLYQILNWDVLPDDESD